MAQQTESTYDVIHLADSEFGNETMRRAADEHFAEHPAVQFVQVYEHGGWYLGYRRDGSTWCTANDSATGDQGPRPTEYSGRDVRRNRKAA